MIGLSFGFTGLLDDGSSGYGLKYGSYGLDVGFQVQDMDLYEWIFTDGLDDDTGFGRLVLQIRTSLSC